jgi:hypothetical protein
MLTFFFKCFHELRSKFARVFGDHTGAQEDDNGDSKTDEGIGRWGWQLVLFRICGWNLAQRREILNMATIQFLNMLSMEIEYNDYQEELQKKAQNRLH